MRFQHITGSYCMAQRHPARHMKQSLWREWGPWADWPHVSWGPFEFARGDTWDQGTFTLTVKGKISNSTVPAVGHAIPVWVPMAHSRWKALSHKFQSAEKSSSFVGTMTIAISRQEEDVARGSACTTVYRQASLGWFVFSCCWDLWCVRGKDSGKIRSTVGLYGFFTCN